MNTKVAAHTYTPMKTYRNAHTCTQVAGDVSVRGPVSLSARHNDTRAHSYNCAHAVTLTLTPTLQLKHTHSSYKDTHALTLTNTEKHTRANTHTCTYKAR